MAAAVDGYPWPNLRLPFVDLIYPAVKNARKIVPKPWDRDELIRVATIENVKLTRDELRKHFGLLPNQVKGGVYDLATQLVTLV